jgi:hypothetical protein
VAFYVFYDIYGGNGTVSQYNTAVKRCLSLERTFSLFQSFKVLDYMNISFSEIVSLDATVSTAAASKYAEKTNAFAYYVLAGIIVFNAAEFIEWCISNNANSILQATHGALGTTSFTQFISGICKNKRMLSRISRFETSHHRVADPAYANVHSTMRMTVW